MEVLHAGTRKYLKSQKRLYVVSDSYDSHPVKVSANDEAGAENSHSSHDDN